MNRWLLLFLFFSAWSCGPNRNEKIRSANTFYDITGLIDRQVKLLDSISPSLHKKALIDGKEEILGPGPKDAAWVKELMIFRSADINRPILAESYTTLEKTVSGIKTITYKSKTPETTHVDSLSIVLMDNDKDPASIHVSLSNNNLLFESEKTLALFFKIEHGQNMLSGYKIEGWQKMISKDSASYLINADIIYP